MYSLNIPVPGRVHRRIDSLSPELALLSTVRTHQTLVVKRFGSRSNVEIDGLETTLRRALNGKQPFKAAVTHIDSFSTPASGTGIVVFLAVSSPHLLDLHTGLCSLFEPIEGIEGPDYVPHITLGRSENIEVVATLLDLPFEPIEWTVTEFHLWDATYNQPISKIAIP